MISPSLMTFFAKRQANGRRLVGCLDDLPSTAGRAPSSQLTALEYGRVEPLVRWTMTSCLVCVCVCVCVCVPSDISAVAIRLYSRPPRCQWRARFLVRQLTFTCGVDDCNLSRARLTGIRSGMRKAYLVCIRQLHPLVLCDLENDKMTQNTRCRTVS
jgi:hypothetical protein